MSLKIAFTGAESTGKTTLVNELVKHFPDVPLLTSFTRSVPNYLDKSSDVQKQLMAAYTSKLLEFSSTGFICDRTIFDVCAYSIVKGVWSQEYIDGVLELYSHTSVFPDYIFYTPIEFPMVQDGGRPEGTRVAIDEAIHMLINKHAETEYITVRGSVEQRMETILRAIQGG
jgi:nicotinamide riboside kinase